MQGGDAPWLWVSTGAMSRGYVSPVFLPDAGPCLGCLLRHGRLLSPAREIHGRVTFRWDEEIAPLSVHFAGDAIDVFDGDLRNPDLAVSGRLPDIVHMATAPLLLGIPNPASRHGLAAILGLYRGRVTLKGDRTMARRLIQLLAL